ncbi:MAG: CRTAC1 family protein [Planctomycetes bacterium]|nr:CRTAC1 family protein [Planctomycetota bacterium]
MIRSWLPTAVFAALAQSVPAPEKPASQPAGGFVDITESAGIKAISLCGAELSSKKYILEVNGGGIALFDADGDGDLDVWMTNGSTLENLRDGKPGAGNTLWLNDGAAHFTDATKDANIGGSRFGNGVAVGDVDNDGDLDVFVSEFGPDCLYLNDGKAHFKEIGGAAGLVDPRWSSSATFLDYDKDGMLDLFVCNYLKFNLNSPPPFGGADSTWRGHPVMRGPRGLEKEIPLLYHNGGTVDGIAKFNDVTVKSGIGAAPPSFALGCIAIDYDLDGFDDIYVANDSEPNEMYHNKKNGTFERSGDLLGVSVDDYGRVGSGMGVCAGDYAGDGRFSIVVTNFSAQANNLFRPNGDAWSDFSFPSGMGGPSVPKLGWGCQFFDADQDGLPDLMITNGHVYPEADLSATDTSYAQNCQFFKNIGNGKFNEISSTIGLADARVHRGAAFGDLDGDGDIDVAILVMNGPPRVLRNDIVKSGAWVAFELQGTKSNRSAYGTIVKVTCGSRSWIAECQPGSSFQCSNDPRVRFGLGRADRVDEVELRWPSGTVEHYKNLQANRVHRIVEGAEKATIAK